MLYRRFRQPRYLSVCLLLLALALSLIGCGDGSGREEAASGDSPPRSSPVAAVELTPRDLTRQVDLVASVQPQVEIRVPGRMSGHLERVYVEEGDQVEAGDLLARFDAAELLAEASRARAEVQLAQMELENKLRLRESDAVSRHELQRAQTALAVAEAERDLWETRLGFAEVRANRSGVITVRHVESGEAVDAQDVLFELAALDTLTLRPQVSERDVVHLASGQVAAVRIDALPGLELEGELRRVFPAADRHSRLVTVELMLPPDAQEAGVQPGFLARIRLQVDPRPDVLAVPAAAIGEDGSVRYVYVIEDGELQRREVEPGETRGQWTVVNAGLDEGEVVLASNPIDMRAGDRVRIVGWRE